MPAVVVLKARGTIRVVVAAAVRRGRVFHGGVPKDATAALRGRRAAAYLSAEAAQGPRHV